MEKQSRTEFEYKITDIGIITVLTSLILFAEGVDIRKVAALLVSLSFCMLAFYFDRTYLYYACFAFLFLLCFVFPEILFFVPFAAYQTSAQKRLVFLPAVFIIPLFVNFEFMGLYNSIFVACITGVSVYLSFRSEKLSKIHHEAIVLRDTTTEKMQSLNEKNKDLMLRQDYEVHVATLKERNRIAREIHDNVGHMLTRSILQMGALKTIHKEEPLHSQLESINETLNTAMTNIRESVHDMHDESIDLKNAINDAVSSVADRIDVSMDYDMSENVPRNVKYALISIAKEAVSNVIKHSDASTVKLILREHPAFFKICIDDNGSTARLPDDFHEGIGLSNMRNRVEELGGTIRFEADKGFHIFISIPK